MPEKQRTEEEIVAILREAEKDEMTISDICRTCPESGVWASFRLRGLVRVWWS